MRSKSMSVSSHFWLFARFPFSTSNLVWSNLVWSAVSVSHRTSCSSFLLLLFAPFALHFCPFSLLWNLLLGSDLLEALSRTVPFEASATCARPKETVALASTLVKEQLPARGCVLISLVWPSICGYIHNIIDCIVSWQCEQCAFAGGGSGALLSRARAHLRKHTHELLKALMND